MSNMATNVLMVKGPAESIDKLLTTIPKNKKGKYQLRSCCYPCERVERVSSEVLILDFWTRGSEYCDFEWGLDIPNLSFELNYSSDAGIDGINSWQWGSKILKCQSTSCDEVGYLQKVSWEEDLDSGRIINRIKHGVSFIGKSPDLDFINDEIFEKRILARLYASRDARGELKTINLDRIGCYNKGMQDIYYQLGRFDCGEMIYK